MLAAIASLDDGSSSQYSSAYTIYPSTVCKDEETATSTASANSKVTLIQFSPAANRRVLAFTTIIYRRIQTFRMTKAGWFNDFSIGRRASFIMRQTSIPTAPGRCDQVVFFIEVCGIRGVLAHNIRVFAEANPSGRYGARRRTTLAYETARHCACQMLCRWPLAQRRHTSVCGAFMLPLRDQAAQK